MPKSREEIENLKHGWRKDPIWDIEDTPGFEAHRDELVQFRHEQEQRWKELREKRQQELSSLVCPIRDNGCILERCAWWDSEYEKCTQALPGYIAARQFREVRTGGVA